MVVCRYFQQGACNFGECCRFEHPRQQGFGQQTQQQAFGASGKFQNTFAGGSNNQFAALSNTGSGDGSRSQPQQAIKDMQPQEIIDIICQEMRVWETSHMWPFSCFTYAKDSHCITGFEDLSPEELRTEAYETRKANNFHTYQMKVSTLSDEYRMKRQALRNPTAEMKQKLLQEIQAHKAGAAKVPSQSPVFGQATTTGAPTNNVFGNTSAAPAQGLFGKPAAQPTPGLFSSSTTSQNQFGQIQATQNPFSRAQNSQPAFGTASAFGGGQNTTTPANVFGVSLPATGSVFAAQPTPQGVPFGSSPNAAPTPFGQPAQQQQPQQALFGKPANQQQQQVQPGLFGKGTVQPPTGLFGKPAAQPAVSPFGNTQTVPAQPVAQAAPTGLFGKPATAGSATGLFGKPASVTGTAFVSNNTTFSSQSDSVYTPLAQLTEEEKAQFSASKFVLGQIPTRPPPREMV